MKRLSVSMGLLLLSGCMTSNGLSTLNMSEANTTNLTRISIGMDEGEVQQTLHSPYNQETVQLKDDQYDVWFYVTNPTVLGQTRMVHYNLTPLTFRNDVLVSIGWDYYQELMKSKKNLANLSQVSIGMVEGQVRPIMHIPDKTEAIQSKGAQYDVWFYTTKPDGVGQASTTGFNFTPLIFKNNKLVSMSSDDYDKLKADNQANPYPQAPPAPPNAAEQEAIKNALNPPAQTQEAPLPNTPARTDVESQQVNPLGTPSPEENTGLEKVLAPEEVPAPTNGNAVPEDTSLEKVLTPSDNPQSATPKEAKPTTPISATTPASPQKNGQPSPKKPPQAANVPEDPKEASKSSKDNQKANMSKEDEDRVQQGQEENFDFW